MKEQIIEKLREKTFPDLKFFLQDEVLDNVLAVLEELLVEEKKDFEDFLKIENKDIKFDDLEWEDDDNLNLLWSILNHFESVESNEKIRKIIEDFMPKLQDFWNEVTYSKPYFEKIVYMRENLKLDKEQKKILDDTIRAYKVRWINLSEEKQAELKEINKELWKLSEKFDNNLVDAEKEFEYVIKDFEVIKELPKEVLDATKKAYVEKFSEDSGWLFDSDPTSFWAIMKYCSSSKIREDFEKFDYTTASFGKFDNREIILKMLQLKDKKAKILWFKNYAELSLDSKMAKKPEKVFDFILSIFEKAKKKAKKEKKELLEYFDLKEIETYDFAYYTRKLRDEKYKVDEQEIKKYFEFENVLNYLHRFIEKFYSIKIKEVEVESYHKDVRVYEIYKDSELIAYYFLDAFYRKGKRPGAWADTLRSKDYFPEKKVPVVLNVCNFFRVEDWKTTLLKSDVETLFHEFWHALHEMLSESKYSSLSWFNVEWDFVELPSQLMECWVTYKKSLVKLWKHFETGEVFPEDLIKKMKELKWFMTWHFVARQNQLALLDMFLHSDKVPETVEELDKKTLEIVNKYWLVKRNEDYKMYTSFWHIFGWGYSAWYYSYMWAEILEADVFARIKKMWAFSSKTWEKLLKTIIWQGSRKKAEDLFFDFMWREVDNKAFLKRYSLK